jgi:hypothetical protein
MSNAWMGDAWRACLGAPQPDKLQALMDNASTTCSSFNTQRRLQHAAQIAKAAKS